MNSCQSHRWHRALTELGFRIPVRESGAPCWHSCAGTSALVFGVWPCQKQGEGYGDRRTGELIKLECWIHFSQAREEEVGPVCYWRLRKDDPRFIFSEEAWPWSPREQQQEACVHAAGTVTLLPRGLDQESRTISVVIILSSRSLNVCRQLLCPGCKNIGVLSKTNKRGTGSCRFPASESWVFKVSLRGIHSLNGLWLKKWGICRLHIPSNLVYSYLSLFDNQFSLLLLNFLLRIDFILNPFYLLKIVLLTLKS